MKKYIILLIIVLLLAGGGFFLFNNKTEDNSVGDDLDAIVKLSDEEVFSPVMSQDGSTVWFMNKAGRIFKANTNGSGYTEYPIPAIPLNTISEISWSKSGSDFIAVGELDSKRAVVYYNSETRKYTTLSANIQKFDWLNDGKRIVLVWKSGDNVTLQLVTSNSDGTGYKVIATLPRTDYVVKISPDNKFVLLYRSRLENDNPIYKVDLSDGKYEVLVPGRNLSADWTTSDKFVYAVEDEELIPKLLLFDLASRTETDLGIRTNLEKVSVNPNKNQLYFAVPKSNGVGDQIMNIDLNSLKKEIVADIAEEFSVKILLSQGGTLVFVKSSDNKPYSIK